MVAGPAPDPGEDSETQPVAFWTVHAHSAPVARLTVPEPPPAGDACDCDDSEYVQGAGDGWLGLDPPQAGRSAVIPRMADEWMTVMIVRNQGLGTERSSPLYGRKRLHAGCHQLYRRTARCGAQITPNFGGVRAGHVLLPPAGVLEFRAPRREAVAGNAGSSAAGRCVGSRIGPYGLSPS
jgi:hypothetical protein